MRKIVIIIICLSVLGYIGYHEAKTHDLKNSFIYISNKLKEKKPEQGTEEMVNYLKNKAKKDADLTDKNTLKLALKYIKNNIENAKNIKIQENLIYYGALLQYSPKTSDEGSVTLIGIKTIDAVSDVYVKDNSYKKQKSSINKTKAQIIKALINRVDIN